MFRSVLSFAVVISVVGLAAWGCGKSEPAAPSTAGGPAATPGSPTPAPAPAGAPGSIAVKVGVVIPKTGPIATYGDEAEKGILLAEQNARTEGKVNPSLVRVDNGGTQQQTVTGVNQFIDSEKVSVIVGPITSNNAIQAGDRAEAAGVPLVTPSATNVGVTQGRKYVFRVCYTDDVQGKTIANFAYDDLGARRAAILINNSEAYSIGLSTPIMNAFKARGGEIVSVLSFMADTDDFGGQITQLKIKAPDVVFLPAYYESAAKCMSQARAAGLRAIFVGTDGWDSPDLYTLSGGAVRGNYFSTHFSPLEDRPVVKKFVQEYRAENGKDPGAIAALSYDAAGLVFDAVKRAGSADRQAIANALAATKDFEGVTGRFSIDENHNPVKNVIILETGDKGATIRKIVNP